MSNTTFLISFTILITILFCLSLFYSIYLFKTVMRVFLSDNTMLKDSKNKDENWEDLHEYLKNNSSLGYGEIRKVPFTREDQLSGDNEDFNNLETDSSQLPIV